MPARAVAIDTMTIAAVPGRAYIFWGCLQAHPVQAFCKWMIIK